MLFTGGALRLGVSLVEEALGKVDTAQRVLVVDRNLVKLDVGTRVLDIGLHQRRALLDILDQHFLARDGLYHQGGLFGSKLVRLLVLWFFFGIRAGRTHCNDQEGEGYLPKRHVKLLGFGLPNVPLAAREIVIARPSPAYVPYCSVASMPVGT